MKKRGTMTTILKQSRRYCFRLKIRNRRILSNHTLFGIIKLGKYDFSWGNKSSFFPHLHAVNV